MTVGARLRGWRLWPMLWKELVQVRRDRITLGLITVIPVVQLLLFGYAVQTDVRHLATVVLDESRSSESRALIAVVANTGVFDIVEQVPTRRALDAAIQSGRARAGLAIPPTYMADVKRGRTARAQMIIDAADPQSSGAALAGAQLAAAARGAAIQAVRTGPRPPPLDVRVRPWYNPAQVSALFIVPGVVGILLTLTCVVVTSTAIVRERERGTLEQLIVTPIDKSSLMLGKIVPFILIGYVQFTVALLVGHFLFDVPIRGSLPLLYAITMFFILASLGVGLLISTVTRTQLQAFQVAFFYVLPNILLSGYVFPREAMPAPAQWIGAALPLTHYLVIVRSIVLKGVGFEYLWRETLILLAFSVGLMTLSVRRFAKTIE